MNSEVQLIGDDMISKKVVFNIWTLTLDNSIDWLMIVDVLKNKNWNLVQKQSYQLVANPVASEESLEKQKETRRPGKERK